MSIWNILVGLFHRSAQAAVAGPAKAVTGVVKDVSGATKDVTGIRKDLVETELAKVELKEKTSLVHAATFEDVKHFDPKVKRILAHGPGEVIGHCYSVAPLWIGISLLLVILALLAWGFGIWAPVRIALYVAVGLVVLSPAVSIFVFWIRDSISARKRKQTQ